MIPNDSDNDSTRGAIYPQPMVTAQRLSCLADWYKQPGRVRSEAEFLPELWVGGMVDFMAIFDLKSPDNDIRFCAKIRPNAHGLLLTP
ncbi:MAG: hypothetical protein JJU13_12200 [Balneolaceae bacterium]|nr:hypothetical protein [Balneolaceae bacterium]